jgi:hypothetical protein
VENPVERGGIGNRRTGEGPEFRLGAGGGRPRDLRVQHHRFIVDANDSLKVLHSTFSGGVAGGSDNGGLINVQSNATLQLEDVEFTDGNAVGSGGCLNGDEDSVLELTDVTFSDCHSAAGGALSLQDGATLTWTGGSTDDTSATVYGGALMAYNSTVTVTDVSMAGASVDYWGGCVTLLEGTNATFDTVTLDGCYAGGSGYQYGGAVMLEDPTTRLNFIDGAISDSEAYGSPGGGVYVGVGTFLDLRGSAMVDHNVGSVGAGIYVQTGGDADLWDEVLVAVNEADSSGGGVYVVGGGIVTFNDSSELYGNLAEHGAGAYVLGGGELRLNDDVQVRENVATVHGGGVHLGFDDPDPGLLVVNGTALTMGIEGFPPDNGVVFHYNQAPAGAAVYSAGGVADIENAVFDDHSTYVFTLDSGSETTLTNCSIYQNHDVFSVTDSTVVMESDLEVCDPLVAFDFAPNRYCSEIRENNGRLLDAHEGSDVLLRTTGLFGNEVPGDSDLLIEIHDGGQTELQTCAVGQNVPGDATNPTLVQVDDGGNFDSRQSSYEDEHIPIEYLAGSSGDFQRNAAWDPSGGTAVHIVPTTLTGGYNMGDWTGTMPGGGTNFPNTDPGWVVDPDRGDMHLDCSSAALDVSSTDGPFDIDGNARPYGPTTDWDIGAIEFSQACP